MLALLTVAALVAAGFFALQVREDARIADARDEAPAAAERAAKAILSYDYRRLPTDRKRAKEFLTPKYQKEYDEDLQAAREAEGRHSRGRRADQDRRSPPPCSARA